MEFRFEAHLPHQEEAIGAVLGLFEGGLPGAGLPCDAALLENLRGVQERAGLALSAVLEGHDFTIDMETGTGKTYVYLRTLHELHARLGLSRAVIVVPSVAIREGVLQQIRATMAHFKGLYGGTRITATLYDPACPSQLARFAEDPGLQVLVLNMDAFNKGWSNRIHRPSDGLGGRRPSELISGAAPVVILDEPQNLDGPSTRAAVEALSATLTLRYSATHRRHPNLLCRLDPVRAYDLGLVKRIEVIGVTPEGTERAMVDVLEVQGHRTGVRARIAIDALVDGEVERKTLTVRGEGEDLREASGGREIYDGWTVTALDGDQEAVTFANGQVRRAGGIDPAGPRFAVMERQIEETVREHLELMLRLSRTRAPGAGLKVLSLFFIERVAHYAPDDGPIRRSFEATYGRLAADPRYEALDLPPADRVHAGYFARRKDQAVDTKGRSKEDAQAYELIMRDKARLLDREEPVQFLFSHSALREGWDNPNVFQICTLHPTRSEMRKRQEIGRGLRLPIDEGGRRITDPDLVRLVVIANERYETFARQLQREHREDHGRDLGDRIVDRRAPRPIALRQGWDQLPAFRRLWSRVGQRLPFVLAADSVVLAEEGRAALAELPPADSLTLRVERARGGAVDSERVHGARGRSGAAVGDPMAHLQRETNLTRSTLSLMLREAGVEARDLVEPERLAQISARLRQVVMSHLCARLTYDAERTATVPSSRFEDRPLRSAGRRIEALERSIHTALPVRGEAESTWLRETDTDPDTELILAWPPWLGIETPAGVARPSWAVLRAGEVFVHGEEAGPRACAMEAWCQAVGATWSPGSG